MLTGSKIADSTTTSVVASETSEVAPPMTPATPSAPARVGDEQRVGGELALDVVQRLEPLPGDRAPHDDRRAGRPGPAWTAAASKVWIGLPSSSIT